MLGHHAGRAPGLDFARTTGRDMRFYMQTEQLKNIMIENENFENRPDSKEATSNESKRRGRTANGRRRNVFK